MKEESITEFGKRVCSRVSFPMLFGLMGPAWRSGGSMRGPCLKCGADDTLFVPLDRQLFCCFKCFWGGTMVDYCCELFHEPSREVMIATIAVLLNEPLPTKLRAILNTILETRAARSEKEAQSEDPNVL